MKDCLRQALLSILCFCSPAFSTGTLADEDPWVHIPVNHFPPWVIVDGEEVSGVDADLIRALLAEVDLKPAFIPCPWARCLKLMDTGQADLMLGLFRSSEREGYMRFLDPPYYSDPPKAFYTHVSRPFRIRTMEDLRPLQIGMVEGTLYFPEFDEDTSLRRFEVTDNEQLIGMLRAGRIDTFISTPVHIDLLLEKLGLTEEFNKQSLDGAEAAPSYIAASRKSARPELAGQLSQKLGEWAESGRLNQLIQRSLRLHLLTPREQKITN